MSSGMGEILAEVSATHSPKSWVARWEPSVRPGHLGGSHQPFPDPEAESTPNLAEATGYAMDGRSPARPPLPYAAQPANRFTQEPSRQASVLRCRYCAASSVAGTPDQS